MVSFNKDSGAGRSSSGRKPGSLSQNDFLRWEEEHRQKVSKKGDDEGKEIERVKNCVSLAMKGGILLLIGIAGISAWPILFTTNQYASFRTAFVIPFSLIALIGLIVVIIAGVKFFSSKSADTVGK